MHLSVQIADISSVAVRRDDGSRSDPARCFICPVNATADRVERIYRTVGASDVEPPPDHRRRPERRCDARKSECPLQLKLWHIGGAAVSRFFWGEETVF